MNVMTLLMFLIVQDERLLVDYVVLDVVARAKSGAVITDLTVDDFEIRDGRKKVRADHFEILDFAASQSGATSALEDQQLDPVQQTLILLFDTAGMSAEHISETIEDVQIYLEGRRSIENVQMFAFSLDVGVVSKRFTTDALEVIDDLTVLESKLTTTADQVSGDHRLLADLEVALSKCFSGTLNSAELMSSRDAGGMAAVRPCLENNLNRFTKQQLDGALKRFAVMERFVGFLARVPGLKSVYMFSPGWSYQPGQAAGEMVQAFLNLKKDAVTSGVSSTPANSAFSQGDDTTPFSSAHFQMPLNQTGNDDLAFAYQRISHLALANRVVMHTLYLPSESAGSSHAGLSNALAQRVNNQRVYFSFNKDREKGVSELARFSGGYHQQVSDVHKALEATVADHRYYYVLAYPKPKVRKGKFRKVSVKCKRPDVVLQHRMGYFPVHEDGDR